MKNQGEIKSSNLMQDYLEQELLLLKSQYRIAKTINIVVGALSLPVYFSLLIISSAASHQSEELKSVSTIVLLLIVAIIWSFVLSQRYKRRDRYKQAITVSVVSIALATIPAIVIAIIYM